MFILTAARLSSFYSMFYIFYQAVKEREICFNLTHNTFLKYLRPIKQPNAL